MLAPLLARCARWWRDPLSHPDIARMSERERADLPFEPRALCPETAAHARP